MKNPLKFDEALTKKEEFAYSMVGFIFMILLWQSVIAVFSISNTIFPSPINVIKSFPELVAKYNLFGNLFYSIKLNFYGYIEAILISIPLGFIIGMYGVFNGIMGKWVDAIRFIPLTAVTGIFIGLFGVGLPMRVHFLSFGIIIYLLPIFVGRISEVDRVHKQTIWTLGATRWQTFRYVYFPSVMSKIINDIRVIVAVSWTYIIVAESIAKDFGVGAMIATAAKQGRTDMVFAILVAIIGAGYLSDLVFKVIDKVSYPYKYEYSQVKNNRSLGDRVRNFFIKNTNA